jgi:hypothetical protein
MQKQNKKHGLQTAVYMGLVLSVKKQESSDLQNI